MLYFLMLMGLIFPLAFTTATLFAYAIELLRGGKTQKHIEEAIALANEN